MSINLYFIGNCKEFMTYPNIYSVSYGWGIDAAGKLRKATKYDRTQPIVIDDSIIAPITTDFIRMLLPYCEKGCILDFERKPGQFHTELLQSLEKISPIWLSPQYRKLAPKAYCMITCELPHNSWKSFCMAQNRQYGSKWVLEYHPLQITKECRNFKKQKIQYLPDAICMTDAKGNLLYYYDTVQTIMEKRNIAAQYGCQGMICIAEEWKNLRKK